MIKGIIFDLDGTLLSSEEDINNSLNYVLKNNGYPIKDLETTKQNLGYGSYKLVASSLPKNTDETIINKIYLQYIDYYNKHNDILTKPYNDILTLLSKLKEMNIVIAVASNKFQSAVSNLNKTKFNNLFDIAIGESDTMPLKPNPKMLIEATKLLNLETNNVLYVGDTEVDFLTAKNANIKSVGVTWGFRTIEQVKNENPNYIINNPLELIDIIKSVNK